MTNEERKKRIASQLTERDIIPVDYCVDWIARLQGRVFDWRTKAAECEMLLFAERKRVRVLEESRAVMQGLIDELEAKL